MPPKTPYAIWAVTPNGEALGRRIQRQLTDADLYLSASLASSLASSSASSSAAENRSGQKRLRVFEELSEALSAAFDRYRGHIFIMSAGIVVRTLAPLIRHKAVDPAVVVIDDNGRHVISLLSGHIGGANALATTVAGLIDATPVITTATDVNQLPAIDTIACELGLEIENIDAVKSVHMALLEGGRLLLHDPLDILGSRLPRRFVAERIDMTAEKPDRSAAPQPGVFVDDRRVDLPRQFLVCRPPTLAAGIGCNRGTPMQEIVDHLLQVMDDNNLARGSLMRLASIDLKQDETGLNQAAAALGLPIAFYAPHQLESVDGIENPSAVVAKHIGVSSVCEAAAILAADRGELIVCKQTTPNTTVAIARRTLPS